MSNPQTFAEHDRDETPSPRADDALTTPTAEAASPVFLTRREAREAERRAAAAAAPGAVAAPEAAPTLAAEPVVVETAVPTIAPPEVSTAQALPTRASLRAAEAASRRGRTAPQRTATASRPAAGPRRTRSASPTAATTASARSTPAARTAPSAFQRTSKRVTVVGAMMFAGAMLVATSVPANAFFVDTPEATVAKKSAAAAQSFVAGGATDDDVSRDGYSVTEMKVASEYASTSSSTFSNDMAGTVQWPFQTGVPISSGFGARQVSNCSFCSTFHEGLDFVPGAGSPIQAIADGTVSVVTGPSGAFGNHVEIEHVIDGQKVTSTYSHMQTGSVEVKVGDTVTVGQLVGKVGSTGNSTGAHLHFEIHLAGVPVDPYPWLQANTN
ncbi:peptidoglycan DD-metalloendopeptidase family protein [Frigoribacterium endophyticum]|uniref:peptidoglycan DD-metalloendopeptidase family protein n=1 Tax=Frigoribacterium endophyticum TaxID=1522176 RepID=UPI00141E8681|nr:murein DD-endopeptidase MepM/ murein hydrolase activator NlpD [Frigoribacterium endophyticum]